MLFYIHKNPDGSPAEERLRIPRKGEIVGKVIEMSGGSRMIVACQDGKERMARIPGSIRRRVWVKEGDVVLVEPWSVEGDEKCDIRYRYTRLQVDNLQRRNILPPGI